jgi:hypothetical protein
MRKSENRFPGKMRNSTQVFSLSGLLRLLPVLFFLNGCSPADQNTPSTDPSVEIVVPDGKNMPVLIDGIFQGGEWDDAIRVQANDIVTLYCKKFNGHLFLAIGCKDMVAPVADLYFSPNDSTIYQLHVSAQLGEIILKPGASDQDDPQFAWGRTEGWYANEIRWDARKQQYLIDSAGVQEGEAFARSMYPHDAIEYQFLESKFGVDRLKFRAEIIWGPNYDTPTVFPANTERKKTDNWTTLILK